MNKSKGGGALPVNVPRAKVPNGSKQSSGKTKHARMTTGAKVETTAGLPKGC